METLCELDVQVVRSELLRSEVELFNLTHPTKYSFASLDERSANGRGVIRIIKKAIDDIPSHRRDELARDIADAKKGVVVNAPLLGIFVGSSWKEEAKR